jgi:hypothetical protein
MKAFVVTAACGVFVLGLGLVGCDGGGGGYREVPKGAKVKDEPHDHHHDHGPHGGHIVEWGDDEYHAEVTHDAKANKITVYILDGSAKKASPIDAKTVTLELTIDGKPKSFSLAAAPQEGDPKDKSSRFELAGNDDIKAHVKDIEDLKGTVSGTVGGKKFSGEIEHHH